MPQPTPSIPVSFPGCTITTECLLDLADTDGDQEPGEERDADRHQQRLKRLHLLFGYVTTQHGADRAWCAVLYGLLCVTQLGTGVHGCLQRVPAGSGESPAFPADPRLAFSSCQLLIGA